jgi:nitrogen fixation NifU-like protein
MDLYADNILDHYRHPRGTGELTAASVRHTEENLSCGDELTLDLRIVGGKIKDIAWRGKGCAISQAAMSMLSEELLSMSVKNAQNLKPKYLHELLGVTIGPRRQKCALLCLHTLKNALKKHAKEPVQSWTETIAMN